MNKLLPIFFCSILAGAVPLGLPAETDQQLMEKAARQIQEAIGEHSNEDFFDHTLPEKIEAKPVSGERYEAQVPDTPEFIDFARRSLNAITLTPHPNFHEVPQIETMALNPPVLERRDGSLLVITPKWAEAIPYMRAISGSNEYLEEGASLIGGVVHLTGIDGLNYEPIAGRAWAFYDPFNKMVGRPFFDTFGEGRQLLAYASWYQYDGNPLWKKLALKKIKRLLEISVDDGGVRYFHSGRGGVTPWDHDFSGRVPFSVLDVGVTVGGDLSGGAATYMSGFTQQAAAQWHELTGDEDAMVLARGLARFVHERSRMFEPVTGRTLIDHTAHVTHTMVSTLGYALRAKDMEMAKWVKLGLDHFLMSYDPEKGGLCTSKTGNDVNAELPVVAIQLSRHGLGNYWEQADRIIRNTFLPAQFTEKQYEQFKNGPPLDINKDPSAKWVKTLAVAPQTTAGLYQLTDGLHKVIGTWNVNPGAWVTTGGTTGNCWRSLYYIWDSILTDDGKTLRVNLHFNRASAWADLDSYIPYEGKLVLKMKKARQNVMIRIPEWTDWNQVVCARGEKNIPFHWAENGYIVLDKLEKDDRITVQFPMREWTVQTTRLGDVKATADKPFNLKLRGGTLIESDYSSYKVKTDEYNTSAPMRTITRFVPDQRFIW